MIKGKKALLLSALFAMVISVAGFSKVTAKVSYQNNTTLIEKDGLDVEMTSIKSGRVYTTEDYIKQNLDSNYASFEKFEESDYLLVKHLIAEESGFSGDMTIDELYNGQEEALIWMNDVPIKLYNVDDNSNYYVAYADTMHLDSGSYVADHCFSYTNMMGEVIEDAIYDDETGIAYVPKKYKEENKNGRGNLNVQVELLQIVNDSEPLTSFVTRVNVDEDIVGEFATSGVVTVDSVATEFAIELGLDEDSKEVVDEDYFKVLINGIEVRDWKYYKRIGTLVIATYPSTIGDLEINISPDYIKENKEKRAMDEASGKASFQASWQDIPVGGTMGTWVVNELPNEGDVFWVEGTPQGDVFANFVDVYLAWRYQTTEFPMYAPANNWDALCQSILNGGNVSLDNLVQGDDWIVHNLRFNEDINVDNKFTIPGGTGGWLKCSHGSTSFSAYTKRQQDKGDNWDQRDMSWKLKMKVYKVTNEYMIIGFLTCSLHDQAGTGIYKIAYTTGGGNLEVAKRNPNGECVAGARLAVSGPNGFYDEFTSEGSPKLYEKVEPGIYTVTEITAPTNMIKNTTPVQTEVVANQTAYANLVNNYQRGSVNLVKYDSDHRGNTLGDATLQGALYNLYAAQDIWEGGSKIYSANDLVKADIETKVDGSTDDVGNLPIGNYYYKETRPSTGFNLNPNNINVSVTYAGQDSATAVRGTCEGPEGPVYGNIQIIKNLAETDYDAEIRLEGARFKATLDGDHSQVYYSNYSGSDGICRITDLPYGWYTVEECDVPAPSLVCESFRVFIDTQGCQKDFTITDPVKDMDIEVFKTVVLKPGEKTDAVLEGAVFTLYKDANCTLPYIDKNGNVVKIGPTDRNGYAISLKMKTARYYIKETEFPRGMDPDAVIPNENVTYRDKVYVVEGDNTTQTQKTKRFSVTIKNEPIRNKIEIIKKLEATSNTSKFPLDQCEFTATLKSSIGTDEVYSVKCTAPTTRDTGYCVIENLPYGEYVVEETKVSPISLKCSNFDVFVDKDIKSYPVGYEPKDATQWYDKNPLDEDGSIVDVAKVMQIKIRKVDANRKDTDPVDLTQGDASLYGAVYQIYRYDPEKDDYSEYVYDIVTDHKDEDGYVVAESGDLLVGKYMVKEKVKYTEKSGDKTIKYSYAKGYLVDEELHYFDQKPENQTVRLSKHHSVSKEEVVRGALKVVKYDNENGNHSTELPSKGAILRLTLDSNPEVYYDCVIGGDGKSEFVEEKSMSYYPYTLPFGKYTITEIKESNPKEHTSWFIQSEPVDIDKQDEVEYRIESDEPVRFYLQIQKRDAVNGAKVLLSGGKYKVWNVDKKQWVEQTIYPSGEVINEFTTESNTGLVTLPETLEAGKYVIYETESPKGYYLEDKMRVPENEKDLGNEKVAGKLVNITKSALKVVEDEQYHQMTLFYEADVEDRPLVTQLDVEKKGEVLADATAKGTNYGEEYTPVYKVQGLANVKYNIIAATEIKSPDESQTYVPAGKVVDTLTTDANGYASSKELFPGEYRIVEISTPEGYLTDTNIPNVKLVNENKLKRVETSKKELNDIRQKLGFTFDKVFEEVDYADSENLVKWAKFGVYANQDIKSKITGNTIIPKGALVEILDVTSNDAAVASKKDLPAATYVVKELDASYPYSISKEQRAVTLKPNGHVSEKEIVAAERFINTFEKGSISLVKLSSSNMENVTLTGDKLDKVTLDEKIETFVSEINGMDREQIKKYLADKKYKFVGGAKYEIFTDENLENPLFIKNKTTGTYEKATITTDDSGIVILENVPLRKYYLKEVEAPKNYMINPNIVEVELVSAAKDSMIYNALVDDSDIAKFITKVDIFTSELIPNCEFEIAEKESGKVLFHATTNEKGLAYVPVDMFENEVTYTYTEIKAPAKYKIDTNPHEFVAKFDDDGEWATEPIVVKNERNSTLVKLIKTDDEGNRVPDCVFELKSDETGFYEVGRTDENGIYEFHDVPYGKYTYTELEAPEKYEIDTTPHEIEIYGETMEIHFVNTGDIAVYALAGIAFACVLGLAFVVVKKVKTSKEA